MPAWLRRGTSWWLLGGLAAVCAAGLWRYGLWLQGPPHGSEEIQLHDVTAETGITFRHDDGGCGQRYIMETVSAGVALFDYDGDGWLDIYFPNGAPLQECPDAPRRGHALYRNLGGWKFQEVTVPAGVPESGYGLGVTVGDYDNDGFPDLFVNNFGPNALYHNNGDGTFSKVTEQAGVAGGDRFGAGACFLDIDGDGQLDLFVANYLKFSYAQHTTVTVRGVPAYVGPQHYPPETNLLYRNQGDGTFADWSAESGIAQHPGWGMGVICADYDNDGDTDIFVANDGSGNFLFENDGTGHFQEVGLVAGTAFDGFGSPQGSMGVDCGDFDHDGTLDFYKTAYQLQHVVLYRNLGAGRFEDCTFTTGAGGDMFSQVTWGAGFSDFNNDGHLDLYIACGHLQDRVEEYDTTTLYEAPNRLLKNDGTGKFINISDQAGDGLQVRRSSRGVAFGDLDNDGRVDVVVLNSRREPTILRNATAGSQHWLEVSLVGVKSNREGVGAHVKVVAGELVQLDEVHSGRGYQSHYGTRLHFGLGNHKHVERLEVRWIGGGTTVVQNVAADQRIQIVEDQGLVEGHGERL